MANPKFTKAVWKVPLSNETKLLNVELEQIMTCNKIRRPCIVQTNG